LYSIKPGPKTWSDRFVKEERKDFRSKEGGVTGIRKEPGTFVSRRESKGKKEGGEKV